MEAMYTYYANKGKISKENVKEIKNNSNYKKGRGLKNV